MVSGDDFTDLLSPATLSVVITMTFFSWKKTRAWAKEKGKTLFPVYEDERTLFAMLLGLFSLISFNYSLLRTTKDVLVLSRGGSEILSALKLYFVFPAAVLYTSYYVWLCNHFRRKAVFVLALLPFLVFFVTFITILYPYEQSLRFSGIYDAFSPILSENIRQSLHSVLSCIEHWPFALYYVMAELWGSVALGMLFWGLSNSIVTLDQSKRFYALLGIGANVGLIASGPYIECLAYLTEQSYDWLIASVVGTFVLSFLLILKIHSALYQGPLKKLELPEYLSTPKVRSSSWFESMKILCGSRQLLLIASLVVCYGLCMNMVEIVWKTQVLKYFYLNSAHIGADTAMQRFFSNTNALTGLFSIFLILFVSRQTEKRYGWTVTALLTPLVLLAFAIVFYVTSLSLQHESSSLKTLIADPLLFIILLGAVQNIFSKAAKYSLFDPTKEKAYFSLTAEQRSKGKSAVDIMGARFGKAGGAFVQQLMIIMWGSLAAGFNLLSGLVIIACGGWILAVVCLGRSVESHQRRVEQGLAPERLLD